MPEIQVKDKLITLEELGTVYNNTVNKSGDTMTGQLSLTPAGSEGGQILLGASSNHPEHAGINIDQYGPSKLRIFGQPSADRTSITGVGTSLEINPYAKTITGGYTFTGNVTGTASGNVAKSGDTMTGPLKWGSATALSAVTNLQYFLGIDAFADGGTTHYITAANLLAAIGAVSTSDVINVAHGGTGATGATGSRTELTAGQNITNKNSLVRKWGKIGVFALYFEVTAQINAYAHIFTSSSAYKADSEYNGCVCDSSGKSYPVCYNADGILFTRVAMPAGTYYGNLSFFFV